MSPRTCPTVTPGSSPCLWALALSVPSASLLWELTPVHPVGLTLDSTGPHARLYAPVGNLLWRFSTCCRNTSTGFLFRGLRKPQLRCWPPALHSRGLLGWLADFSALACGPCTIFEAATSGHVLPLPSLHFSLPLLFLFLFWVRYN